MWKHIAYIRKGLSHEAENLDCQDSIQIHEDDTCLIAALADGLGSLKYSALASQTATATACQWLAAAGVENLLLQTPEEEESFRNAFSAAVSTAVREAAEKNSIKPKLLDCTLAFVYISKVRDHVLVGMIGDSAVCIITEENSYAITDSGSFAGGTRAVLDRDAGTHMLLKKCSIGGEKILGFILTSDGLDNEIYIKGSNHVNQAAEDYFNVLVESNPAEVLEQAITTLTSYEDTPFDDDISIAVISRAKERIELEHDPTWLCTCGCRNVLQNTYCVSCNQDFTRLYSNVRFREHGGKAAFFKRINQDPEEERKLIGLPPVEAAKADATNSVTETAVTQQKGPGNPDQKMGMDGRQDKRCQKPKHPQKASSGSGFPRQLALAAAAVFAVGAIAGMLIGRVSTRAKIDDLLKDVLALRNEVLEKDAQIAQLSQPDQILAQLPGGYAVLEDGSYYWGELDQNGPTGNGILLMDDVYYVGSFVEGQRNGQILVIPADDGESQKTVEYIKGQPADSAGIKYTVIYDDVNVRSMPGTEETTIVGNLSKDEIVIGTGTITTVGETQWAEIFWENGNTAWLIYSKVEHDTQGEEQATAPEQTEPQETVQDTQPQEITYVVLANELNVRNQPGKEGTEKIGRTKKGDQLTGTGNQQTVDTTLWVEIVWENGTGWVAASQVEKVS